MFRGRKLSFIKKETDKEAFASVSKPRRSIFKRPSKRAAMVTGVVLLSGLMGFGGGLLSQRVSDDSLNNLSNQKKIVQSSGKLISQISKDVGPSVVSINTETTTAATDLFGYTADETQEAAGTGMVISSNGYILTNRHVVPEGTTQISIVMPDGTTHEDVDVVGRTSEADSLDVAILKINNLGSTKLKPVVLGNSEQAAVGDTVVAIGNALGRFQNTVTAGIISGFGRSVVASSDRYASRGDELINLIQTDTAINQGNSGGPLVNVNGEVIGINTAIASEGQNVGFAIPINDVKSIIEGVLKSGKFEKAYLGVRYIQLTPELSKEFEVSQTSGAYIVPSSYADDEPIVSGSPAEKAGLKAGDIISKVNGQAVTTDKSLATVLNRFRPGELVRLTVLRDGKAINVNVKLEAAPTD